jgi:hypothetical protein
MADPSNDAEWATLVQQAERVLGDTLRAEVRLKEPERLTDEGRRNLLLRCAVETTREAAPAKIVIKRARQEEYRPDDPDSWATQGLFRDWAGLQFLQEAGVSETGCPRFYGGDRANGFVVMDDLGSGEDLANRLLHGSAESAEEGLLLLASVLGRMHGATVGREDDYLRIRTALSASDKSDRSNIARWHRESQTKIVEVCSQLSVSVPEQFGDDVETVAHAIEEPGPFLAYTHGDPCPDNTLIRGNDLRLFDYEFGAYRHALLDGVYGRIRFPTCWCVGDIPEPVVERMEAAYRKELAKGCPAAENDDLYRRAVLETCASWLMGNLASMLPQALEEDGKWGIATYRQRLLKRLAVFIALSKGSDGLGGLRNISEQLLDRLETRWGDELEPLPLYPAFSASTGP